MSGDLDLRPDNSEPEGYIVGLDEHDVQHYVSHYDTVGHIVWWSPARYHAADKLVVEQLSDIASSRMTHAVHSFRRLRKGEAIPTTPGIRLQKMWFELKAERKVYSLALYIIDRCFGGPEEGGWWYDQGIPVSLEEAEAIIPDGWQPCYWIGNADDDLPEELFDIRSRRNNFLDRTINVGRPDISSVLSDGIYQFYVVEGHPHRWPKEKPIYE